MAGSGRVIRSGRKALTALWLVAAAATIAAAGWLAWGRGSGAVAEPMPAFATLKLADTPNQYLILPAGFAADATPHAVSPIFDIPVQRLERLALEVIRAQPRTVQVAADPAERTYAFVQRTALLRFPDTVTIRFIALGANAATLAMYSRSKIGHSDFGTNRKRVEEWVSRIRARLDR